MDPGAIAVSIPLVVVFFLGITWFSRSRLGGAIAERIAGSGASTEKVLTRLDDMQEELVALRQEVAEAHERLDFAERLLADRGPGSRAALEGER